MCGVKQEEEEGEGQESETLLLFLLVVCFCACGKGEGNTFLSLGQDWQQRPLPMLATTLTQTYLPCTLALPCPNTPYPRKTNTLLVCVPLLVDIARPTLCACPHLHYLPCPPTPAISPHTPFTHALFVPYPIAFALPCLPCICICLTLHICGNI